MDRLSFPYRNNDQKYSMFSRWCLYISLLANPCTLYYCRYTLNFYNCLNEGSEEAEEMKQFIVDTLTQARADGEKVMFELLIAVLTIIITSVPR